MTQNPDSELGFQIIGVGKSFTVYADSLDNKKEWMIILQDTITKHKQNYNNKGGEAIDNHAAAVWIPDDAVDDCMLCKKEFSQFLRRKHHCRRCGIIICSECSRNKAIVPGVDKSKEVRICDKCKDKN